MIRIQRFESHPDTNGKRVLISISIVVENKSFIDFQTLVQRGGNLWSDATPEIKEFVDLITEGIPLGKVKKQKEYKLQRIVMRPHTMSMTVMCSCGIGQSLPQECIVYQCSNCKTNHIIKDYVK